MLKILEKAIYDEFGVSAKVLFKGYNEEGNFIYLAISLPNKLEIFRKYIVNFSNLYLARKSSDEDYICSMTRFNYD